MLEVTLDPTLVQIGPLAVTWPGLSTAVALVAGSWLVLQTAARAGLPIVSVRVVLGWALLAGALGGRVGLALSHPAFYLARPAELAALGDGGGDLAGALLAGGLGAVLVARRLRLAVWTLLDAVVGGLLLGLGLAPLGAFVAGAAWGRPTGAAWGVVYWHPHALLPPSLLGVPLQPLPLYQSGAALLVAVALWWTRQQDGAPGQRFLVGATGYCLLNAWLLRVAGTREPVDGIIDVSLPLMLVACWSHPALRHRWRRWKARRYAV